MLRRLLLIGLLCVAALGVPAAHAQKIHALIVADMCPAAQWGIYEPYLEFDAARIQTLLEENAPFEALTFEYLFIRTDEQSQPDELIAALDRLQPGANDTLLLYYTGHGGLDDEGSYLSMARGKLYRDHLLKLLAAKGARLAVLLTDCCNARSDGKQATQPRAAPPDFVDSYTPLFQSLMIEPRGIVDVSACAPGQSAFFAPPTQDERDTPGSLFTKSLEAWCKEHRQVRASWDQLIGEVGVRTHLAFRAAYPDGVAFAKGAAVQRDQNVYARDYPGKPSDRGPRAGIAVRDDDGLGAMITEVVAGSPAERAYDIEDEAYVAIRPGARITVMNGRPISSAAEFEAAIAASPQILRMTVETPNRGTKVLLVRLRY